ncbi:hypothetical protein MLD38_013653 [Melastoma candidum]|uniref:Uncharacterized protein n=1 Tax=Melastoma candidum TaxID=119954 RepID=A0ACB9RIR5_9MYRT|nr:hypothetical protein MLD38_013653 [Melastoma candidum]
MAGNPDRSTASDSASEGCDRPAKVARIGGIDGDDDEVDRRDVGGELETMNQRNPGVQRYLVAIEYIGTRFSGSQQQLNCRTVVGVLEDAFKKFIGHPVSIFCSSRTDAGVHALSNVCHVDVERTSKRKPGEVLYPHEPFVVKRAVNHFLQKNEGDVMITDVRCVPQNYHARYKALERTYFYRLLSGPEPLSTFEKDRAWHVPQDLDILAMQKACNILVGQHDFSSFRAAGCQANSPIRTLDEFNVTEMVPSPYFPSFIDRREGNLGFDQVTGGINGSASFGFGMRKQHRCIVVTARARSFLYHQVRLLVGVLKAVGTGDLNCSEVARILEAKDVTKASRMAPACGLYLGHVKYELP